MTTMNRKQIGDTNQQARQAAMDTINSLRGQNVNDLKLKELADLVALLMQWLGLADASGIIK